jgi:hypothetical protein
MDKNILKLSYTLSPRRNTQLNVEKYEERGLENRSNPPQSEVFHMGGRK